MNSIRFQLSLALVLAGLFPLLIFAGILHTQLSNAIIRDTRIHIGVVAEELAHRIEEIMEGVENDLHSLQSAPIFADETTAEADRKREIERLLKIYDGFYDISVYDPSGIIVDSTNMEGPDAQPYRDHTEWFKRAVSEQVTVVSIPKRKLQVEGLFLDVYLPVTHADGETLCVIKASLGFDRVKNALSRNLGKSGYFVLMDQRGNLLYHPNNSLVLQKHPQQVDASEPMSAGDYQMDGEVYLFSGRRLSAEETHVGSQWYLIGYLPRAQAEALIHNTSKMLWGVLGLVLCIALVLGGIYAANMAQPIIPLIQAARNVAKQKWDDIHLVARGPKEIREVASSFNTMVGEIRSHHEQLENKVEERTLALQAKKRELAQINAQMEAAFQSAREGVLVVDSEGGIRTINRQFCTLFAFEGDTTTATLQEVEACVRDRVDRLTGFQSFRHKLDMSSLQDGETRKDELPWRVAQPVERFLKVYCVEVLGEGGVTTAYLWVFRDHTEARRLEKSLQQAQKMEAVGRLAGGIAHDFNNLLTGIMGNLFFLQSEMGNNPDAEEHLGNAMSASQRATELVKQLLGFSRQSYLNRGHYQTNPLVEEVVKLCRSSFDPRFQLRTSLTAECWNIDVDSTQLNQVLMNLCVNARDAMEEKGLSGLLTLSTTNVTLTEAEATLHSVAGARAGQFVRISVADTGTGIKPEVLTRIFEPFFTTKNPGKGTGLGLATSYGIVEQHGGWMTCDSKLGEGTTFNIFLPRDETIVEIKAVKPVKSMPQVNQGTETILLVDDDPTVRLVTQTYLKKLGYTVLTAENGQHGLDVFRERRDEIDLAMLDLTMPVMTGSEAFKHLRDDEPCLPVIIYSGYLVDNDEFEAENGSRPDAIICKPFNFSDIARLIRNIFDSRKMPKAA